MAFRLANRVAQYGVYSSTTPGYVNVDPATYSALTGYRTFNAAATADGWSYGDRMPVFVKKDDSNFWVGIAEWHDLGDYLELSTLTAEREFYAGSFTNGDSVTVYLSLTAKGVRQAAVSAELVVDTNTTIHSTATHSGVIRRCTNSSLVTYNLRSSTEGIGESFWVIAEGAGGVNITTYSTSTINGANPNTVTLNQWEKALCIHVAQADWVVTK